MERLLHVMGASMKRDREVGGLATLLIGGLTVAGATLAVVNGLDNLPLNWMMSAQDIQCYIAGVQAGEDLTELEIFYGASTGMVPAMAAYGADVALHGLIGGLFYRKTE